MLKKILALSVAAAFMLSLGSAAAFASTPAADATKTTGTDTPKTSQTARVEQPNFYLDVQPGTMTDRLTITAKVKSEDKLILRRAKTDGKWENVGEAIKVTANGNTSWQNLLRQDTDGSYFSYQVVALAQVGTTSPAIRVSLDKTGAIRLTAETATVTAPKPDEKNPAKPGEATKPSESDKQCNQTTDPQNKDKQDNKDNKDNKNNKATQTTTKPAATTTSKPTASTSRTTTPTSSTKVIPKTGQVGSLAPLGLLLVSGGLALLRRRQ